MRATAGERSGTQYGQSRRALRLVPPTADCADEADEYVRTVTGWWPLPLPKVPDAPEPGWRDRAACAGMDVDLFFPPKGRVVPDLAVIAACHACPVRGSCIADGLEQEREAQHGIRGGVPNRTWARGLPSRHVRRDRPPCGTPNGYQWHRRNGEQACQACREAHTVHKRAARRAS